MKRKIFLLPLLILSILTSCNNESGQGTIDLHLFKVTTDSVKVDNSNLSASSFEVCVFGITDQDNSIILDRGVCYGEKPNPKISDSVSKLYEWNALSPYLLKTFIEGLKGNTVYHFRNFVVTDAGIQYGNDLTYTTTNLPVLIKASVKDVSNKKMSYACRLVCDGGSQVLSAGIVWSKSKNPTIDLDTQKSSLSTNGNLDLSGCIEFLEPATTYYARCYATNKNGVTYSNEISFITLGGIVSDAVTDIDGNVYQTIKIGDQIWMAENLRTTRYRNGDYIKTTSPATEDISLETEPAYQWPYDGDELNAVKYGRLYTWYAATDVRNIAPEGWHVPTEAEINTLEKYLMDHGYNSLVHKGNYANYLGKALASESLWEIDTIAGNIGCDVSANNISGFNVLPVGVRCSNSKFAGLAYTAIFWNKSEYEIQYGLGCQLCADYPDSWNCYCEKFLGCSVRCIKDKPSAVKQASGSLLNIKSTPNSIIRIRK